MKHTILCVDDEINNVDALERLFRKKYTVLKATSADEGLALARNNNISLIISDQRMPNKTGVEFLRESREFAPEAIRILLTGYTDIESAIDAINSGQVYRYISKPWDPADLLNTIDKAIEKYELSAELKEKNIELEKALSELKVLDEAKDKFMILINHELKTPLTVILSFLELLSETDPTEEQKKYFGRIEQSSHRLKRIVDDSLLFISAETGKLDVSTRKISSEKLFDDLSEKYEGKIKVAGKALSFKGDVEILQNVLDRLVANGLRHGKKDTSITLCAESADHGVKISVSNEGKAISKKIIEGLRRPFNLDKDIMKHSEGLGLGLSVSQALLKRHGSALEFSSDNGVVSVSFVIR
jgi:signal transduction histidine kinase